MAGVVVLGIINPFEGSKNVSSDRHNDVRKNATFKEGDDCSQSKCHEETPHSLSTPHELLDLGALFSRRQLLLQLSNLGILSSRMSTVLLPLAVDRRVGASKRCFDLSLMVWSCPSD